jgi:hypothetical protein
MTALLSVAPDDLDQAESCATTEAIANLAQIHGLPQFTHLYASQVDGRTTVVIAVPEAAAQQWRAAFGAPPYAAHLQPTTTQWKTQTFWAAAACQVRLSYSTPE